MRFVVSDLKLVDGSSFRPDVRSYANYYPYGLPQPNRTWSVEEYRFGFNGVEKENTTFDNGTTGSGEGKMLAMDFRMYDARLGRWWGQDPIVHPWESPYAGMGNDPVNYNDPLGLAKALSDPLAPAEEEVSTSDYFTPGIPTCNFFGLPASYITSSVNSWNQQQQTTQQQTATATMTGLNNGRGGSSIFGIF